VVPAPRLAARTVGRAIQRVRNRLRPHAEPLRGLPSRLLRERDRIVATLGPEWLRALLATIGRWAFDYGTLLAALAAVGSHPRPALVLLASRRAMPSWPPSPTVCSPTGYRCRSASSPTSCTGAWSLPAGED
jgi:hypothetical protein